MRVLFKNQVVGLVKRCVNFLLVFCLLIFTTTIVGGAITTRDNVSHLFTALENSGYYQSQVTVNGKLSFSNQAFSEISNCFFNQKVLTTIQKKRINHLESVTVSENNADYQAAGCNMLTWLLKKTLDNGGYYQKYQWSYLAGITARIICQTTATYNAQLRIGFNDFDNSHQIINHQVDKIVLMKGRVPNHENEVVVTPSFPGLAIGNYLIFNQQRYQIVGIGFTLINYLADLKKNRFVVPTVYFVNHALASYWLINHFTSINQKQCGYYISINPVKFQAFMKLFAIRYFQGGRPVTSMAWATNFLQTSQFIFVKLQIIVYFWVAIFLFILTLLILVIFLKKELERERRIWGILLEMGYRPFLLSFVTSIAYLTILLVPVLIGFGFSFLFQWYLTNKISQVLLLVSQMVIISQNGIILNLVIIPLVLFFTLMLLLRWYLVKPVLELINPQIKNKVKSKKPKRKYFLVHRHNFMIVKWMLVFFQNNIKPLLAICSLFCFTSLFIFIIFNGLASYEYSQALAAKVYQPNVARSFIAFNNPTFTAMIDHVNDDCAYSDYNDAVFQWVSKAEFQQGIINHNFTEITNISHTKNFYHKYITDKTFASDLNDNNFNTYVQNNFPELWQLIIYSQKTWAQQQKWPTITFGFKLYNPTETLLFNTFNGVLVNLQTKIANTFTFLAFDNSQFTHFFYYDNVGENDSLAAFEDTTNQQQINAILPLALARQLQVSIGDTLLTQIDNVNYLDASWNQLPLQIVGINRDNYLSDMIMINRQSLVNFFRQKANQVMINNVKNISDNAFLTTSLAILDNVGFYQTYATYTDIHNFNLVGQPASYFMNDIDDVIPHEEELNDFLQTLQFLITLIAIFAILVLFLLVFLIFYENQTAIIILKLLGYHNHEITIIFSLPYLFLFVIILGVNFAISYFLLQLIFAILFQKTLILLLFHFSYIFTFSIIAIVLISLIPFYSIAFDYISRQKFTKIVTDN